MLLRYRAAPALDGGGLGLKVVRGMRPTVPSRCPSRTRTLTDRFGSERGPGSSITRTRTPSSGQGSTKPGCSRSHPMRYSVQYAACAYGHIGSCVSIGLSSHGPGSFIYPTQDHPDALVVGLPQRKPFRTSRFHRTLHLKSPPAWSLCRAIPRRVTTTGRRSDQRTP
jgi:hypothetical protein